MAAPQTLSFTAATICLLSIFFGIASAYDGAGDDGSSHLRGALMPPSFRFYSSDSNYPRQSSLSGALEPPPMDKKVEVTVIDKAGNGHKYQLPETSSLGALHSYHNAMSSSSSPEEVRLEPSQGHTGEYTHLTQLKDFDNLVFHERDINDPRESTGGDAPHSWLKMNDWEQPDDPDVNSLYARANKLGRTGRLEEDEWRGDVIDPIGAIPAAEDAEELRDDPALHGRLEPPLMEARGNRRFKVVHDGETYEYDLPATTSLGTLADYHMGHSEKSGSRFKLVPRLGSGEYDYSARHTDHIGEAGTDTFEFTNDANTRRDSGAEFTDYVPPAVHPSYNNGRDPYAFLRDMDAKKERENELELR